MDWPSYKFSSGMSESRGKGRYMGNSVPFTCCDNCSSLEEGFFSQFEPDWF